MTDTLLLVGRQHTRAVAETHAMRLRERGVADRIGVDTYDHDPAELSADTGGETYVVPMAVAPTRDTTRGIPGALPTAHHCEPVGTSPAVSRALADRAREAVAPGDDASLALLAFGDTSREGHRRATEAHATRLRESTQYGEVTAAYLLQNPAAECVRYNLSGDRAVAVPFFIAPCEETDSALPAKLELDRGGLAYADPLGDHEAVTDAIEAEVAKARSLGSGTAAVDPVATDGGR
ncbi:sirohydrochlorin chelatase [Natronomonas sp. CBA1123]|uniref:CbiX/SirB N-terminal domain-containing protein n=1 Tax=Natronomonas sp. CBA1123 TaxID=2668070 RepID=UPI0012E9AE42|nr:CbiX/SirB N-terminal domain-containing protein [Natronomonas sp. CBA1123]MUV88373.1 sirohydrochlorin chelatase [Natronomonas sp. CBA1123]